MVFADDARLSSMTDLETERRVSRDRARQRRGRAGEPTENPVDEADDDRTVRRRGVLLYSVATVLFIVGLGVLGWKGYQTSLDIKGGNSLNAVSDPTKPGYEAQVRPTPTHLLINTDGNGKVVDLELLVEGADSKGGAVIFIPGVMVVESDGGAQNLTKLAETKGIPSMLDSLQRVLGVGIGDAATVSPTQLEQLLTPAGPLTFENPDALLRTSGTAQKEIVFPAGQITVAPADAAEYLSFVNKGESEVNRTSRAKVFWDAWVKTLAEKGDAAAPKVAPFPSASGDGKVDLATVISQFGAGVTSTQQLPLEAVPVPGAGVTVYRGDRAGIDALLPKLIPFPASAYPGQRPRVSLLNGTTDTSAALRAATPVVEAGAQITVLGNASNFHVSRTTIEYHDPAKADAAKAIATKLGVGPPVAGNQSDALDITVTIGADYQP